MYTLRLKITDLQIDSFSWTLDLWKSLLVHNWSSLLSPLWSATLRITTALEDQGLNDVMAQVFVDRSVLSSQHTSS